MQDGILVDAHGRTSDPAISAAGDCTRVSGPARADAAGELAARARSTARGRGPQRRGRRLSYTEAAVVLVGAI